jgi:predicted DNA-binding protein (MmcQ/YjbR family)
VRLSGEQIQDIARRVAEHLPHVTQGRPFTPHLQVWKASGKVFLIVTEDDPDNQVITVKVDPHHGEALRREHPSITAGQYLNKHHWVTVGAGSGVTEHLVETLVRDSYEAVVG